MGDPIEKQRAIVAAMTHGRVHWTKEHRDALVSAMEHRDIEGQYSAQIWKDIWTMLSVMIKKLPKEVDN